MRVLAVVHQADAGLGVFATPIAERGHDLVEWTPARSAPPPEPLPAAAIVLGGGMHPDQEDDHPWLRPEKHFLARLLEAGTPTLAVCLGAELLAEVAGAPSRRMPEPVVGWREISLTGEAAADPVLRGLPERFTAFEWHSFETPLPPGAVPLAQDGDRVEAFRLGRAWAIQFHAEVTDAIVNAWIDAYREDPDLVAAGLDAGPLRQETRSRIGSSNEVGAAICGRFLDQARDRASGWR